MNKFWFNWCVKCASSIVEDKRKWVGIKGNINEQRIDFESFPTRPLGVRQVSLARTRCRPQKTWRTWYLVAIFWAYDFHRRGNGNHSIDRHSKLHFQTLCFLLLQSLDSRRYNSNKLMDFGKTNLRNTMKKNETRTDCIKLFTAVKFQGWHAN